MTDIVQAEPQLAESQAARQRAFGIAYAVTAISVLGASAVSPVLPAIGQEFGVDGASASLLVSLFILPMAVLTLPIGFIADRLSLRPVLIACLLLYGVAGLACAVAPGFHSLLALRILQGCGAAALELFGLVILIEAATEDELHSVIGKNVGVIGLSTTLAPVLSGVLSLISWRATFLSAAAALPLAYAVSVYLPRLAPPARTGRPSLLSFLIKARVLAALFATLVVFLFLFGVLLSFVPDKAVAVGARSGLIIALIPASCAIAIGLVAPRVGGLLARFGYRTVTLLSLGAYALAMVAFFAARDVVWLDFGAILVGVGHGLLFPLIQSILAGESPSEGRVMFMSFNITAIGLGQTLAPLLMSVTFEAYGLQAVFVLAFVVALAMIPLSWAFFKADHA